VCVCVCRHIMPLKSLIFPRGRNSTIFFSIINCIRGYTMVPTIKVLKSLYFIHLQYALLSFLIRGKFLNIFTLIFIHYYCKHI